MMTERRKLYMRRMYPMFLRCTLLWGFIAGILLGLFVYRYKRVNIQQNETVDDLYEKWFSMSNLRRTRLSVDFLQYGSYNKVLLEASYLHERVPPLVCVVLVRKKRYAAAVNETWGRRCHNVTFVELRPERTRTRIISFQRQVRMQSSWRILCDALRSIDHLYAWALVTYDDIFALPENVRRMVGALDSRTAHYLGHAVHLWGVPHNAAQAGYVLSRGALDIIRARFNSSEACAYGGRFWRQEDYYLGRHLAAAGVLPADTRDPHGLTTFHSALPERLLPSDDSSSVLLQHGRTNMYPVSACCSPHAVTFRVADADRMYTYQYLLYNLHVFRSGHRGNVRPMHSAEDESAVWQGFVRERGLSDTNISADAYYELWKTVVNDPVHFNRHIRDWRLAPPSQELR